MKEPLVTGYVCSCCGRPSHHTEVLSKRTICCGFPAVLKEDYVNRYDLFSSVKQSEFLFDVENYGELK